MVTLLDTLLAGGVAMNSSSSCFSSTRVGREARDSAVSTSSALTDVLCLLPL